MTTRRTDRRDWTRRIAIGGLNIAVTCRARACLGAVAALTQQFPAPPESTPANTPRLRFSLEEDHDRFRLTLNGTTLWQGPDAGEIVAAFEFHFYNHVIRALFPPLLSLHAATVMDGGCLFTFAGSSGAGKSSLCTAALLEGAQYVSDEFTLLDEDGRIHPFPRPLQWDGCAHPAFTHADMRAAGFRRDEYRFPGHDGIVRRSLLWQPPKVTPAGARAGWIFLPRHHANAPAAHLERLNRAQGVMELAAHVHQHLEAGERIRLLHQRLPGDTVVHRLHFSDCRAAWRAARDLANTTAAEGVSP